MSNIEKSTVFSFLGQIRKGLETGKQLAIILADDKMPRPLPETLERMRKVIAIGEAAAKGLETTYRKTWHRVDSLKGEARKRRLSAEKRPMGDKAKLIPAEAGHEVIKGRNRQKRIKTSKSAKSTGN